MDSDAWGNLIAGSAFVVALAVAVRGEMNARRAASQAAKSEAAAAQSADASVRSAAALERMAEQWAESLSRAEKRDQRQWSARPRQARPGGWESRGPVGPWAGPGPAVDSGPVVHWTVDKIEGRRFQLRNLGQATARDVQLSSDNAVRFNGPDARDIAMGGAVEFSAIGTLQTGTPELVVRWRDDTGAEKTWRRPVP